MRKFIKVHNQKNNLWFNFIFVFCFPQILVGLFFSYFPIHFSSLYIFKTYTFFKNLLCISIYIWSCVYLLKSLRKMNNSIYTRGRLLLSVYIIISLFIMSFYKEYYYSLIYYLMEHIINMVNAPFNEFKCDFLCRAFKFLFTGNFYDE